MTITKNKNRPNWLLRGLISFSLIIHILIFLFISRLYRSKSLNYIEFTIQDISETPARSIPRPRPRPKKAKNQEKITETLNITQNQIQKFKPIDIESIETETPYTFPEGINIPLPDIPHSIDPTIADWKLSQTIQGDSNDFITQENYLDLVRLKIEKHKIYPPLARKRHIEGNVTIRFIITPEGILNKAEIVRPSSHSVLNMAALKAIKDAAPFPKPPEHLFDDNIVLELTIVFELT